MKLITLHNGNAEKQHVATKRNKLISLCYQRFHYLTSQKNKLPLQLKQALCEPIKQAVLPQ